MSNMDEKPNVATDRLMTPVEQITMPIEMKEAEIMRAIEIAKHFGIPADALRGKWQDIEVNRRIILWLDSFADPEEKAAAVERITREGLPPEVFKDDENFIVPGTDAIH